jgi:ABC-type sugar transport system permease subunit
MKHTKKKRRMSLAGKNAVAGYLFILPFLIGFVAFMLIPIGQSIGMAFSEVKIDLEKHGFSLAWNSFANFNKVFYVDPEFNRLLTEEIGKMLLIVPSVLIFSLFAALLINQKFRGRGFVRAVFFLPIILASGVMVGLETNNSMLHSMADAIQSSNSMKTSITGVLQSILLVGGTAGDFFEFIFQTIDQVYNIAMASGVQIIIFLSGLQTVSPSMFEAADIEGATKWECFWKITLPMVSSLILVNVVYSVIDYFVRTDNTVMNKIRSTLMQRMEYGFSMSMAWVYFGVVVAVLAVASIIISKRVYYYDE